MTTNPDGKGQGMEDNHRWSIEYLDNGVRICKGEHHRDEVCEWEYYIKPPAVPVPDVVWPEYKAHTQACAKVAHKLCDCETDDYYLCPLHGGFLCTCGATESNITRAACIAAYAKAQKEQGEATLPINKKYDTTDHEID